LIFCIKIQRYEKINSRVNPLGQKMAGDEPEIIVDENHGIPSSPSPPSRPGTATRLGTSTRPGTAQPGSPRYATENQ
jgi:hypothetical protein